MWRHIIFITCCDVTDIFLCFKMIPVPKKHLPENRPKVLSPEELAERREAARQRIALKKGISRMHFLIT